MGRPIFRDVIKMQHKQLEQEKERYCVGVVIKLSLALSGAAVKSCKKYYFWLHSLRVHLPYISG